jgi:hypothetical protein
MGYYDLGIISECLPCLYKCKSCEIKEKCLTCINTEREYNEGICNCMFGFYEIDQ